MGMHGGGGGGWHMPAQAQGLPFAGIPPEMAAGVQTLLEREPEHPQPSARYSPTDYDRKPFTLKRLLSPHLPSLVVAVALVLVETVTLLVGPLLTQLAIDRGLTPGNLDFGVVRNMALLYLASIAINSVTTWARISFTGRFGQRLMKGLRVRVFSHLQRLSVDYFTDEKAGRVMTRMTSDIEALAELLQDGIVNLFVQALTLVFLAVVLFQMDPLLAAILLVIVVPVMLVLTLWFRSASERTYTTVRDRIADVMADLQESLSGIRIIAAYNRQQFNRVQHRNIVGDHKKANEDAARVAALYAPATDSIGILAQALVLGVGGALVIDQRLTVGQLTAFVLYVSFFFQPIQQLVQLYNQYQSGQAAVTKLRELLATDPSVQQKVDAHALAPIEGEIRLENVSFGYLPDQPVLRGVHLTIAAGETFALVGTTGAGKSTIAKLVTRFYDPTEGRVLVDGTDVRDVTLDSLRRQLGVVPQEPFLFGGSLRDNVAFARPEATDSEVIDACHAVGLDGLIERLPNGIDSPVFERGSSLSSGERQLLALARAFLAQPRVLILDEATSSLDLKTEAAIEHALDVILQGRTSIIIAHRLSTAMRADRIAVIEGGRIVELGSHDELVERSGIYASMYETWIRHAEEGDGVTAA